MKKIVLGLLSVFIMSVAHAQGAYEQGAKLVNAGLGIGSYYGPGTSISIGGSYEAGITDNISVGGQIDFYSKKSDGYRFTYVPLAARASYHFGNHLDVDDNIDLYGGLSLGYYFFSDNIKDNSFSNYNDGGFFVGIYAGGRYYFSDGLGVFAEVGANTAVLKLGVTFKL